MFIIKCFDIVWHLIGEAGKQINVSYVYHHRRYGGPMSPYQLYDLIQHDSITPESFDSANEFMRK